MAAPDVPATSPESGDTAEPGNGGADPAAGADPPPAAQAADDDWVPL
jgi:hypothetical protein